MIERAILLGHDGCHALVLCDGAEIKDFVFIEKTRLYQIYLGRVTAVRGDMNAAFIDIGGTSVFLNLEKNILTNLSEGQRIFVQIIREADGDKAPQVTTDIKLFSRHLLFFPHQDFIKFSHSFSGDQDTFISACPKEPGGVLVRSRCDSTEKMIKSYQHLLAQWKDMKSQKEGLVYKPDMLSLALHDLDENIKISVFKAAHTHDIDTYNKVHHAGFSAVFELDAKSYGLYEVDAFLERLFDPHISTESGAALWFEKTKLGTVIDVDRSHFLQQQQSKSFSSLQVNLSVLPRLFQHIKWRSVGGIILVDFLRMKKAEAQRFQLSLEQHLRKDKALRFLGVSHAGLYEFVRTKTGLSLDQSYSFNDLQDMLKPRDI